MLLGGKGRSVIFTHGREVLLCPDYALALRAWRVHVNGFETVLVTTDVDVILWHMEKLTQPLLSPLVVGYRSLLIYFVAVVS